MEWKVTLEGCCLSIRGGGQILQPNPWQYPWDIVGHQQGSKRPLPGNSEKISEKGFRGLSAPGPLGPGVKKLEHESKNDNFSIFPGFSTLFRAFFDPGAERPRQPLFRLFSGFPKERPF